jgi:hypothetical protein
LQVINVMKRWLNQHFYDFENQPLLDTLIAFIDSVVGTSLFSGCAAVVFSPSPYDLVTEIWNAKWANALRLNIQEKNSTSLLSALHAKSSLELIVAAMKKVTYTRDSIPASLVDVT